MARENLKPTAIAIEPWARDDLSLLESCVGDESMMEHLGGAEDAEKIAERQARYEQPGSGQFKIVERAGGEGIGWVGYWDREWLGEDVYEVGWAVIPTFQRRGVALAATRQLLAAARGAARHRHVHAFPAVANVPSNAICRALGFALLGAYEWEHAPGSAMQCNDWRLDLLARRWGTG
jgi:RimJ/RimL family protein N-acetyltransferase